MKATIVEATCLVFKRGEPLRGRTGLGGGLTLSELALRDVAKHSPATVPVYVSHDVEGRCLGSCYGIELAEEGVVAKLLLDGDELRASGFESLDGIAVSAGFKHLSSSTIRRDGRSVASAVALTELSLIPAGKDPGFKSSRVTSWREMRTADVDATFERLAAGSVTTLGAHAPEGQLCRVCTGRSASGSLVEVRHFGS